MSMMLSSPVAVAAEGTWNVRCGSAFREKGAI